MPGTAAVILNAQVKTKGPGTNGIVAEAARITLLDNTVIVLGHVECLATGPDVNAVTTTSSSTMSEISVAHTGTPRTKFLVPSTGSTTQRRWL